MSYDITLLEPKTKEVIIFDSKHNIKGGTYQLGGIKEAWFNITYNYSEIFKKVLGKKGIRSIYGKTGEESILILENAINNLKGKPSNDYWESTEGNAKESLKGLLTFAKMRPDGIWDGD